MIYYIIKLPNIYYVYNDIKDFYDTYAIYKQQFSNFTDHIVYLNKLNKKILTKDQIYKHLSVEEFKKLL